MRSYGKIETAFWQNPKVRKVSEPSRFLLLYIFSCPHGNSVGCFILPDGYIMADMRWSSEQVTERVAELVTNGFIERDLSTGLTRIVGWFNHNTIENQNVAKAAIKTINALPHGEIIKSIINELAEINNKFINQSANELRNELGNTFANEFLNPSQAKPSKQVK